MILVSTVLIVKTLFLQLLPYQAHELSHLLANTQLKLCLYVHYCVHNLKFQLQQKNQMGSTLNKPLKSNQREEVEKEAEEVLEAVPEEVLEVAPEEVKEVAKEARDLQEERTEMKRVASLDHRRRKL